MRRYHGILNAWRNVWPNAQQAYRLRAVSTLTPKARHLRYKFRPHLNDVLLAEMLETGKLPANLRYRHFTKPKKDGSPRQLAEPNPALKAIQHEILRTYLQEARIHSAAVGYRRRRSIAHHVWPHAEANIIVVCDIADFFPSTLDWRVADWWGMFHDEQVAKILTILTAYRGSLPQGAPTSPAISNAVNYEMDLELAQRMDESGGTYTRYADDLVFSWYDHVPPNFDQFVQSTLRHYGYRLNPDKGWRVYSRRDEPRITGLVLTAKGRVTIPPEMKKLMQQLQREQRNDPYAAGRLTGYQSYQAMVESPPSVRWRCA